jgi:hypothetical protein
MTFLIYRIDFTSNGYVPSGGHPIEAPSAMDALHKAGYPEAIGDKHITEYNYRFKIPTQWVEARNPNESFWLAPMSE